MTVRTLTLGLVSLGLACSGDASRDLDLAVEAFGERTVTAPPMTCRLRSIASLPCPKTLKTRRFGAVSGAIA